MPATCMELWSPQGGFREPSSNGAGWLLPWRRQLVCALYPFTEHTMGSSFPPSVRKTWNCPLTSVFLSLLSLFLSRPPDFFTPLPLVPMDKPATAALCAQMDGRDPSGEWQRTGPSVGVDFSPSNWQEQLPRSLTAALGLREPASLSLLHKSPQKEFPPEVARPGLLEGIKMKPKVSPSSLSLGILCPQLPITGTPELTSRKVPNLSLGIVPSP